LRKKEKGELLKDIDSFRTELSQLRVAQVTGGTPAKLAKMYVISLTPAYSAVQMSESPLPGL
jgi:ribosomal protein L29